MVDMHHQVHDAIREAQNAMMEAQTTPDRALTSMQEAKFKLSDAYTLAIQYADPKALQQIQDAENAIDQACRTAETSKQSPVQTHNAIDQALRACQQIHRIK